MQCPMCQTEMNTREYEGVAIDVCGACRCVWLDKGELTRIVETQIETFDKATSRRILSKTGRTEISAAESSREVLCPRCRERMPPTNYAYSSGVIVNRCRQDHGILLDEGELDAIQIIIEEWQSQ